MTEVCGKNNKLYIFLEEMLIDSTIVIIIYNLFNSQDSTYIYCYARINVLSAKN